MPTISIFFGILIKMYYNDHNPPHFHAFYQGFEAIFDIKSGDRIGGELPKRAENIVREWSKNYKQNLLDDWDLMRKGRPPHKIPGADQ